SHGDGPFPERDGSNLYAGAVDTMPLLERAYGVLNSALEGRAFGYAESGKKHPELLVRPSLRKQGELDACAMKRPCRTAPPALEPPRGPSTSAASSSTASTG